MKTTHAETLAIHAGRAPDPATGAVTPNLIFSSTFARDDQGQLLGGHIYSRTSNPNRTAVETALAALEGGAHGLAFASGQAAAAAIFARASFVDGQRSALMRLIVQALNGCLCFGIRAHFDKTKPTRTSRFTVHNDIGRFNRTGGAKIFLQIFTRHAK